MDRRRHERYDLEAPLSFSWKDQQGIYHRADGTMKNISRGGVFVSTPAPPPVGVKVRFRVFFRFLHARSRLVMKTTARIVRVQTGQPGETPPGFAGALKSYALRNEKEFTERQSFNCERRDKSRICVGPF